MALEQNLILNIPFDEANGSQPTTSHRTAMTQR